jgi:hypothetical protein
MTTHDKPQNTPAGIPKLSEGELAKAKKDGALDYVKQGVAAAMASDTGTSTDLTELAEERAKRLQGHINITPLEPYVALGLDAFKDAIAEDAEPVIPEEEVKGILAIERNGQNRTQYVQALCKRLKVDSPYEVYHGGPAFMNDVSSVTTL